MNREEIIKRWEKLEEENKQIKRENRRLRRLVEGNSDHSFRSDSTDSVSRRQFLKKLGAGAIGLGTLSMAPVTGLKLTKDNIYYEGSQAFLDLSGSKAMTGNLDMSLNNIVNAGKISTNGLSHGLEDGSDISGSQSAGTVYQNTTGYTILVSIDFNVSSSGGECNVGLWSGNTSSLTYDEHLVDRIKTTGSVSDATYHLSGIVPDRGYYKIESFGSETIQRWNERRFI